MPLYGVPAASGLVEGIACQSLNWRCDDHLVSGFNPVAFREGGSSRDRRPWRIDRVLLPLL